MWTYGITYNVPIMYKYNTNKVFQSASKAEDVFRVLLVLKLVLQLGSSVSLLVQEPLYQVKMHNPGITINEYIQLEAKNARRRGQDFNWETATYDKVRYFEDIDYFKEFENEFQAIVYKDALTSKSEVSSEHTEVLIKPQRNVVKAKVLDFEELTKEMSQDMTDRLRMDHTRADGQVVFASHVWRRLFRIRGPLVRELILEFFSTCRIAQGVLDLDTLDTLLFQLGGLRR
ncbi:hypothetical protein Tco_1345511 [Tanacetum coccineum]